LPKLAWASEAASERRMSSGVVWTLLIDFLGHAVPELVVHLEGGSHELETFVFEHRDLQEKKQGTLIHANRHSSALAEISVD
jgi:hypothetical protein